MFKNYLTILLHRVTRQRLYSTVNLLGLVVGITAFLMIMLFVRHELSYDGYHKNADRIVRIGLDFSPPNSPDPIHIATMPPGARNFLKQDFPQIQETARVSGCANGDQGALITSDNGKFYEPGFTSVDNSLFRIFDFDWLAGDPETALLEPFSVVIAESVAIKHFGSAQAALGKNLYVEGNYPVEIQGVFADMPSNSNLNFTVAVSFLFGVTRIGDFVENLMQGLTCYHLYGLVAEGTDLNDIQSQSKDFFPRYVQGEQGKMMDFTIEPISEVHLDTTRQGEQKPPGSLALIQTFSAIGIFILLIACINFINLSTARAVKRAKEVGIRKVVGGSQKQMIVQFIGESMLSALVAVILSVLLLQLILPVYSGFLQADLGFDYFGNPVVLAILAGVVIAVGLVAGSYPAFYLSAFNPTKVLKGDVTRGTASSTFRKTLVVLQFSISISLVIATFIVYEQLQYAKNIELGFDQDQVIVMGSSPTRGLGDQWEVMKQEWLSNPNITSVTASQTVPGQLEQGGVDVTIEGGSGEPVGFAMRNITFDFFQTYGIDLLSGRDFSEEFGTDMLVFTDNQPPANVNIVINQYGAELLGYSPEEIVGKTIDAGGVSATIIGVVENLYWQSIRNAIGPVVYTVRDIHNDAAVGGNFKTIRNAAIRVSGGDMSQTVAYIDQVWTRFLPEQPINRHFLDQDMDALYETEERQGNMFFWFSALAIFIACLGLFGLSWYSTEQRSKEIGVRKVMGGSNWNIVQLFTGEFSKFVLAANVIAWPATYYFMNRWLENFAYRIDLGFMPFIASALLALLVAWLTVGGVSARAATTRPVKVLRYE